MNGVAYACAYACAHQLLVLVPRAAGRDIIIHQRLRHSTSVQGSRRRGETSKKKVVPRRNPIVPRILLV